MRYENEQAQQICDELTDGTQKQARRLRELIAGLCHQVDNARAEVLALQAEKRQAIADRWREEFLTVEQATILAKMVQWRSDHLDEYRTHGCMDKKQEQESDNLREIAERLRLLVYPNGK